MLLNRNATGRALTNSITNTVIKFVFFHLQICHPNAAPDAAVALWFLSTTKLATELLLLRLGSLQPLTMLTSSSLPWKDEKSSSEFEQNIKAICQAVTLFCSVCVLF